MLYLLEPIYSSHVGTVSSLQCFQWELGKVNLQSCEEVKENERWPDSIHQKTAGSFLKYFFYKAEYNSLSEGCAFDNKNFIHYFAWILLQSKVRVDLETTEEIQT